MSGSLHTLISFALSLGNIVLFLRCRPAFCFTGPEVFLSECFFWSELLGSAEPHEKPQQVPQPESSRPQVRDLTANVPHKDIPFY